MNDQFLASILADPGSDHLRLVYADWLEEHREPDRAEFIRLQIEMENYRSGPCGPVPLESPWLQHDIKWQRLVRREEQLLDIAAEKFWAEFPAAISEWRWRRGFVSEVHCRLVDWCGGACERCRGQGRFRHVGEGLSGEIVSREWCQLCHGTGRTGGHGPAIVWAAPIEDVFLIVKDGGKTKIHSKALVAWAKNQTRPEPA